MYMHIYIYIYMFIYILRYIYKYHVPKWISCHKAILVITAKAHCFHDCIHITPILLLRYLSTYSLCVVDHL